MLDPVRRFVTSVRKDFGNSQRYRAKYHDEQVSVTQLPAAAITRIGFQMMIAMRAMKLAKESGVPLLPQVASRLIRHLYAAEVHWNTELADGISIVHGTGLVLSHRAKIGEGCILFHNVTLGEGVDPETRETGAPTLGRDVHVGPGATLIGPIHVGDGTKIMAGAVLTRSVPPNSLVKPADTVVSERQAQRPKAVK